jgi:hypothetical protein
MVPQVKLQALSPHTVILSPNTNGSGSRRLIRIRSCAGFFAEIANLPDKVDASIGGLAHRLQQAAQLKLCFNMNHQVFLRPPLVVLSTSPI